MDVTDPDPANWDFHLRPDSPCIDAGTNEAPSLPATDFEGDSRIIDGDDDGTATADMGVDERQRVVLYVDGDVVSSGDGRSWAQAFKTIHEAIDDPDGNEIWVKQGTYEISAQIEVNKAVAIYGGFEGTETERDQRDWQNNVTTVDGQRSVTCFYVSADATMDGFTITGGSDIAGGGILNSSSSPTITNCTFFKNTAEQYGGGIYNSSSSPTITNCTFSRNIAEQYSGGGIYNVLYSSPTITSCIFSENSAAYGGAIGNYEASPIITNCTFWKNIANSYAGGIRNYCGDVTITNCTFFENTAETYGGGICNVCDGGCSSCSFYITNCILWNDEAPSGPEIYDFSCAPEVTYSDIDQDGYEGADGNIRLDPLFADTANGDFHLQSGSPCIDAGANSAPALPVNDFEGDPRRLDDPSTPDTGNGIPPIVDMGIDEFVP